MNPLAYNWELSPPPFYLLVTANCPFAPFNVSQLEPVLVSWIPNCTNPSLPLIKIDENLKFEVVQVLDSKLNKQRKDLLLYYVC